MICTMDPIRGLYELAGKQHQVVARRQAIDELGIAPATLDREFRRRGWRSLWAGVHQAPGSRTTFETRVAAAALAVGRGAMASGRTALWLHRVLDSPPDQLHIVVPEHVRAPRLGHVRVWRSRTLRDGDRSRVRRLPVATPARALMDAARGETTSSLRALLIDARQRRVIEPPSVVARIAPHPNAPGRGRLLQACYQVDAVGADSVLAYAVQKRLQAEGIVVDAYPVTVEVDGRELHPDITRAARKVAVEADGLGTHGTARGLDLDHRKNIKYQKVGWKYLRITWRRYDRDWDGFVTDFCDLSGSTPG